MATLPLTLACWDYDRTQAIADGRVRIDGVELTYLPLRVEETFWRMMRYEEFDLSEMSLASYVRMRSSGDDRFIAIPIFPSRVFRHQSIFINKNAGIKEPKDLAGKRIGIPEYTMTAGVWIRGILADEYDVPITSVTYYQGGMDDPGRTEKSKFQLPPGINVVPIGHERTLSEMLAEGEIDAIYAAHAPHSFQNGTGNVKRLFPNFMEVEQAYFARTKIFPIMHLVVLRRKLYDEHRWLAMQFYKAFVEAQQIAYEKLAHTGVMMAMLPWSAAHLESTRALMGDDYWPYGVAANESQLETFLRYSREQGIIKNRLEVRELFAPETFDAFKI